MAKNANEVGLFFFFQVRVLCSTKEYKGTVVMSPSGCNERQRRTYSPLRTSSSVGGR